MFLMSSDLICAQNLKKYFFEKKKWNSFELNAQPEGDIGTAAGLTVTCSVCVCMLFVEQSYFTSYEIISYVCGEVHIFFG